MLSWRLQWIMFPHETKHETNHLKHTPWIPVIDDLTWLFLFFDGVETMSDTSIHPFWTKHRATGKHVYRTRPIVGLSKFQMFSCCLFWWRSNMPKIYWAEVQPALWPLWKRASKYWISSCECDTNRTFISSENRRSNVFQSIPRALWALPSRLAAALPAAQ